MDHITGIMLALLRGSLNNTPPDQLPTTTDEWTQVYWLARKHGVVTMINDVIDRLPTDQQPQGDIALSWTLSADRTRYHYEHQSQVLDSLRIKASEQGLQILVLKGLSLSRYYPVPSSRACGDIDIAFLPLTHENFQRGNSLLGIPDGKIHGKHTETTVEGVPVENHLQFLDLNYKSQLLAEQYIKDSLGQVSSEGFLPPLADMVYLLMHTICHITAKFKLPLRNILDWGMFLKANQQHLDPTECHRLMRRIGMEPAFNMLTYLAAEFTGTELSHYIQGWLPRRDIERMRRLMLQKDYRKPLPQGLNPLQLFVLRLRRNSQSRWLYRYLPSSFTERTRNNLKHLRSRG